MKPLELGDDDYYKFDAAGENMEAKRESDKLLRGYLEGSVSREEFEKEVNKLREKHGQFNSYVMHIESKVADAVSRSNVLVSEGIIDSSYLPTRENGIEIRSMDNPLATLQSDSFWNYHADLALI